MFHRMGRSTCGVVIVAADEYAGMIATTRVVENFWTSYQSTLIARETSLTTGKRPWS